MKHTLLYSIVFSELILCSCSKAEMNSIQTEVSTSAVTESSISVTASSVTSDTDSTTQAVENDDASEQSVLEKLILDSAQQNSENGEKCSFEYYDPMFGDFDEDGKNELIALVSGSSSGELEYWYACDGKAEMLTSWWLEWLEPEIVTSGDNTFIKLEKLYLSQRESVYFLLENSTPVYVETYGIQGLYPDGDNGDFTGYHSTYDSYSNGVGHTWKPYWFYYKDKEFHEYVGTEITVDELLKYDGAQTVLDEIKVEGGKVIHILKRENGIINIDYSIAEENDMSDVPDTILCFHFRTLKISGNSVLDITPTYEYDDGTIEYENRGFYEPTMSDISTYYKLFNIEN